MRVGVLILCCLLGACDFEKDRAREALVSPEAVMRAEAVTVLGRSGDEKMAPLVAPLLRDPSARVRRNAVAALGALGPKKYLGKIGGRLRDGDLEVRLAAVRVLGDTKNKRAVKLLLPMLEAPSLLIRRAAARALERLGLTPRQQRERVARTELAYQLKRLSLEDAQLRASAARQIGLAGRPEHQAALLKLLDDRSPLVVTEAARALGRLGGEEATAALVKLASSTRPTDRVAAAGGLGALGALEQLAALAADASPQVRVAALDQMVAARQRAPALANALCKGLWDSEPRVHRRAALAVAAWSADRKEGTGYLCPKIVRLTSEAGAITPTSAAARNPASLQRLVDVLGPIPGPGPTAGLLLLARSLHKAWQAQAEQWIKRAQWLALADRKLVAPVKPGKPSKRKNIGDLLAQFPERPAADLSEDPLMPSQISRGLVMSSIQALRGRPIAAPFLIEVAKAGDPVLQAAALETLASNGTRVAGGPVPELLSDALKSPHAEVRRAAARACVLLGKGAPAAALKMLNSKDFDTRAAGARCLGQLRHVPAVAPLLKLLAKEKQVAVIQALARVGDRRATTPLAALLQQDHHADRLGERRVVVDALGQLGDPAAASALERELSHPHPEVRLAAARALARAGRLTSVKPLAVCQADYHARIRAACAAATKALSR